MNKRRSEITENCDKRKTHKFNLWSENNVETLTPPETPKKLKSGFNMWSVENTESSCIADLKLGVW